MMNQNYESPHRKHQGTRIKKESMIHLQGHLISLTRQRKNSSRRLGALV